MKSLCTLTILALASWFVHAQPTMRPQEQVEALQKSKMPFSKSALFKATPALNDPNVPNAQFTLFQEEEASNLLEQPPNAIALVVSTDREQFVLELFKVELSAPGFSLKLARPNQGADEISTGVYYRGMVKGQSGSLVSLSIYADEVLGLISIPGRSNLTLAKYRSLKIKTPGLHVLYAEDQMPKHHDFHCYTPDGQRGYSANELEDNPELRSANSCVSLYLEVDYDVFKDKGGLDATQRYIMGVFNEVATLYANERISLNLSQLYIWNTVSPYSAYDAYGLLIQFKDKRAGSITGDAGMLVSYKGGGGIAVVDGLCDPFNLGYAGIGKSYQTVPAYSFTVMVLTHELGHILGSHHTHSCVWNGNSTAIDGCPGFTDGGCSTPAVPREGGTIMSYCHISPYGINFSAGFGPQPGNVIRNRIASAACISGCSNTPIVPQPTCGEINLSITLDAYGNETTWELLDVTKAVVDRGGPYQVQSNGLKIQKKICLPPGCYTLRVLDLRGDGLCCRYGDGAFQLTDNNQSILAEGGQFARETTTTFCIDAQGKKVTNVVAPPTTNLGCTEINFNNYQILSFGDSQDQGTASIGDNGKSIVLQNNAWKAIPFEYDITANTFLEVEFRSTQEAEIHGIGFDTDLNISTVYTFQLWGTQDWGYQSHNNYEGTGEWKRYTIPIGQRYRQKAKYLYFACDNDAVASIGNSQFRNIRVYEKNPCPRLSNFDTPEAFASALSVFPNPAEDQVHFRLEGWPEGSYQLQLFDPLGRLLRNQQIDKAEGDLTVGFTVADLPVGFYAYTIHGRDHKISGKVLVKRAE